MKPIEVEYKGKVYTYREIMELTGHGRRTASRLLRSVKDGIKTMPELLELHVRGYAVTYTENGKEYKPSDIQHITGFGKQKSRNLFAKVVERKMELSELLAMRSPRNRKIPVHDHMPEERRLRLIALNREFNRSAETFNRYYGS